MVWAWETWYDQHVAIKEKRRGMSRVLPRCVHLGHVISRMAKRSYAAAWGRWLGHHGFSSRVQEILKTSLALSTSRTQWAAWCTLWGLLRRSRVARKVLAKVMKLAVSRALSKWNEIRIMATRLKMACGKSRICILKRILKHSFFVWCIMNTETKKMERACVSGKVLSRRQGQRGGYLNMIG